MKKTAILILIALLSPSLHASELYETVKQFEADKTSLERTYTLRETREYYQRMDQFYADWSDRIENIDFNSLSLEGRVDYLLLKTLVEKESYFLQQERDQYENVRFVADFAGPLYRFIETRRRGTRPEAAEVAKLLTQAVQDIGTKQQSLLDSPFDSWQEADRAADVIASLYSGLEESNSFYTDYDPDFTWWVEASYTQLADSLKAYEKFLRKNFVNTSVMDDGSGIVGKPIGREEIIKRLQFEFIPYTPEELIEFAEKQYDWCKKEMLKASREMGYGEDWKAALEAVKNTYVPPGDQPELIADLAREAVRFLEDHDLITIPPLAKESWRMEMMTPEQQEINPFFTGGEVISISYPTQSMDYEDKMMSMRGNNPHFSRATVQHELIPGHHLQMFMNARYAPYRNSFDTPFWIEGWALYWELNLWDKGFAQTPEDRIGMLFWRMHRCARIIFSLNFHLGKMTPQECIDMLVDKVGHEYANAEAEVRRSFMGEYGPLYQIAYLVGGLQFYALRNELTRSGRMTEKEFHNRVLREGDIPVAMVRMILQDNLPDEDYHARWHFLEEIEFP